MNTGSVQPAKRSATETRKINNGPISKGRRLRRGINRLSALGKTHRSFLYHFRNQHKRIEIQKLKSQ